jgi:protein-S-isoprenylcysteine O-methyltransferase Ste14
MLFSQLNNHHILLIILWLLYFSIHSLLASIKFKQFIFKSMPGFMPWYRLSFNFAAVVLLFPPLLLMSRYPGDIIWQWSGYWFYLANGLALLALAGFIWSLKSYDSAEFFGTRQLQEGRVDVTDEESLHISLLHRYVRHPWYSFALVLIWTRDMNVAFLITAILLSLYFVLGSRLEERKLVAFHGEKYRQYMKHVAGLVPVPWRILSRKKANEIVGLIDKKESNNDYK